MGRHSHGSGGQTIFEDYLYPTAKPLRLPSGRYFIELKDADAVEISRNAGTSPTQRQEWSSSDVTRHFCPQKPC